MSEHYAWIAYPRKPFAPLYIPSSVLWESDAVTHAELVAPGRSPWRVERIPFDLSTTATGVRKPDIPDEFDDRHPQYLRFMAALFEAQD